MTTSETCVVVGTGHAGAQLALALRQEGWTGRIVLVGEERHAPYQRPPLSKAVLLGQKKADEILLRPLAAYEKRGIELRLSERVEAIDRAGRRLALRGGATLAYDKLALCLGSHVRRLGCAGADLARVHYLRTLDDVAAIAQAASASARAVVIGGGYIGLEAAAALRVLGLAVTVLEMAPRVLARVTSPLMSAFFERVHREEGVAIVTGTRVARIEGDGRVSAVACEDGSRYPADLVIAGIGVAPETALAEAAGLAVNDGIVVDAVACSSDPDIVAAGDCTRHHSALYDASIRLESVSNAMEQARTAAATLCGRQKPSQALPTFWSDQFDVKLQIAGIGAGHDAIVLRGDPASCRSFSAFYLRQGRMLAADCVNRPQDFMAVRRLIELRFEPDLAYLADDAVPLASMAAPAG